MPQVYLFAPDESQIRNLLHVASITSTGIEVVDIEASADIPAFGGPVPRLALVCWHPETSWTVETRVIDSLRREGVGIVAIVDDASEGEACVHIGAEVLDVVPRSRPERLRRFMGDDHSGDQTFGVSNSARWTARGGEQENGEVWPIAIVLLDHERAILHWNPQAHTLFGWMESEVVGRDVGVVFGGETLSALSPGFFDAVRRSGFWTGMLTLARNDGTVVQVWTSVTALHVSDDVHPQYLILGRDLTEQSSRRQSKDEGAVRKPELMENLKSITYQSSTKGPNSLLMFGAVRALTGYDAADFLNGTVVWSDLVHSEDRPRMIQYQQEIQHGIRTSYDEIYRIVDCAGRIRLVKDTAGRWNDPGSDEVVISGLILEMTDELEATDRIALSETMYHNLWEMESDALFLIDRETGQILEVNGTACALYNFERAELLRKRNVDLSAEPERTYASTHSDIQEIPIRWHRRKDGTVFPVEIHATHFIWNERSVHLAAIRDITKRLHDEALLRDAETRYRTFFEQSPDGVMVLDPITLRPKEFNSVAHNQLGFPSEEFSHCSLRDLYLERETTIDAELSRVEQAGRHDFTALFRRKDGRHAEMDVTLVNVELAERPVLYAIFRDVTTRRLVEDNLRTLSRAVEQSPSVIIITSADGIIEYVNPRFTTVTGYDASEVIGQTPRMLKSGLTSEGVYAELWRTLAAGEEWRGELRNKRRSGEIYWALVSISPVRDARGITQHFVAVQEDITDVKMTQQDLIEAKERAERSDHLKDAFIANMSHEIRTPLNIILGFTGLLRDFLQDSLTPDLELCIDSIERGGSRLLRTVEEILNISSIQAGTFPHAPLPLLVDYHVEQTVKDFSAQAAEKQISLEFHPGCDQHVIVADPYVFVQALSNLLDNALKFTKAGGVTVTTSAQIDQVTVEVRDTGIGIAREYLPHLFESFTQEHSGISRPFEGLGLGMALTRRYVEMCSGSIAVNSEKGRGTIFTLVFPASWSNSR